ncbi:hypothetical protein [Sphingomonas sp. SRS2]|uniref:hypothetical protein n=1 Tax=Sphingomonas sp. SRS2 TaxID=133190 RepID=UPI000ACE7A81|nr:hypothetical protein [Sphingomonas sp. SRS2]
MRALLRFWLLGDGLALTDHVRLDQLSARFGLGVVAAIGAIGAIHLVRHLMGVFQ